MPKVSQHYRDARRTQILDAAKQCFLRKGFQATSMQDLFAESGLSSGAFYLYFKGKDDVILALAEENMGIVMALIHELATSRQAGGLGEALASVLETVQQRNRDDQLGAMAVLVWAEALRSPHLRERFVESISKMRADLTDVITQYQSANAPSTDVPADAMANLVISIVPGAILQLALFGERAVDGVPTAARALWP